MLNLLIIICSCILISFGQNAGNTYKPTIRYIQNNQTGLQVSMPNIPGLKFFAFHGAINRYITLNEFGDFDGVVIKAENEIWTYTNNDIKLNQNDVLYFWYLWQINDTQYTSLGDQISSKDIGLPYICEQSETIVNRETIKCKNTLLFEENFNNINTSVWKHEIKIPSDDSPFISYQYNEQNIFIKNNVLNILPTTPYSDTDIRSKTPFILSNCTGSYEKGECERKKLFYIITPPVVSAKLRSNFSFQYGRIEVRAKLPIGDWIIPQLHLEPRDYSYSNNEYSSGQMRIAFIRGNRDLKDKNDNTKIFDGRVLYGGVILEPRGVDRIFLKDIKKKQHFGEKFHTYSLVWTKENIQLFVNNIKYGTIKGGFKDDKTLLNLMNRAQYGIYDDRIKLWKLSENSIAPFDKEFVISLGISVGGMSDFPDSIKKPWVNNHPKAENMFYRDMNVWKKTWNDELSTLQVAYVRVYSV